MVLWLYRVRFLAILRYRLAELVSNTFLFAIDHPRANPRSSLGPPNLLLKYPDVTKYVHREIEVFSRRLLFGPHGAGFYSVYRRRLNLYQVTELEAILEELNRWAKSTGGSGTVGFNRRGSKIDINNPKYIL